MLVSESKLRKLVREVIKEQKGGLQGCDFEKNSNVKVISSPTDVSPDEERAILEDTIFEIIEIRQPLKGHPIFMCTLKSGNLVMSNFPCDSRHLAKV